MRDNVEDTLARYLSGRGPFKLEVGSGGRQKPGWLATDLHVHANSGDGPSIQLDATVEFPIPDGRFDFVFSEHMIEHIPFESGQHMLRECNRILNTGGIVRIVTPSLGFLLRIMSPDRGRTEQCYFDWSMKHLVPPVSKSTNAFFLNNFVRAWGHLFIYDRETLQYALTSAGFTDVRECLISQSEHQCLAGLENETRMPPGFLALESMIFEGTKA